MTEYTIKNGSGEKIKLNIIVTRSPFNPNGQALQIDPRASDTAAFCNVLNSKNGPNPDGFGLREIRRVFQQAIREQQGSLPGDVLRIADNNIGNHADDVMGHFAKACTDLAPKVSQTGLTIRMFADGGGPGGRIQSELSVLNANGELIGHTSSGPDDASRENYNRNNAPAWSGRGVGRDVSGNWASSLAAGPGDTGSPVLRALEKYKKSSAASERRRQHLHFSRISPTLAVCLGVSSGTARSRPRRLHRHPGRCRQVQPAQIWQAKKLPSAIDRKMRRARRGLTFIRG